MNQKVCNDVAVTHRQIADKVKRYSDQHPEKGIYVTKEHGRIRMGKEGACMELDDTDEELPPQQRSQIWFWIGKLLIVGSIALAFVHFVMHLL